MFNDGLREWQILYLRVDGRLRFGVSPGSFKSGDRCFLLAYESDARSLASKLDKLFEAAACLIADTTEPCLYIYSW
jgi:hypothetical protein